MALCHSINIQLYVGHKHLSGKHCKFSFKGMFLSLQILLINEELKY